MLLLSDYLVDDRHRQCAVGSVANTDHEDWDCYQPVHGLWQHHLACLIGYCTVVQEEEKSVRTAHKGE